MIRNCDWVEECEKAPEYYIFIKPDFRGLFFCYIHLIYYIEDLLFSNIMSDTWHFDISRLNYTSKERKDDP